LKGKNKVNKVAEFLFCLFCIFILFCSCANKEHATSSYKIAYVQSTVASAAVSNNSSSVLLSASNSSSNLTSGKTASSGLTSGKNVSSGLTSGNVENTSSGDSSVLNQKSSSESSSIKPARSSSPSKSNSSAASSSSASSQSTQSTQPLPAVSHTINDILTIYNNALNNTLSQNYICYNFINTMNSAQNSSSGNIVIKTSEDKDIFFKTFQDGSTYYCDGSTLFIQKTINPKTKSIFSTNYTHYDFYKYINLIMFPLENSNISSFKESIDTDTTALTFSCNNCSDYSKIADIFLLDSAKITINKVTLNIEIKGGFITKDTQQFDIISNGVLCTCIIDNSFYPAAKDYILTKPDYAKSIK
jgi:hypothetical protein